MTKKMAAAKSSTTFLKRAHRRGRRPARDTLFQYQSKLELVVQTALVSLELALARPQDATPRRLNRPWKHALVKFETATAIASWVL